jgi:hypothetical protein
MFNGPQHPQEGVLKLQMIVVLLPGSDSPSCCLQLHHSYSSESLLLGGGLVTAHRICKVILKILLQKRSEISFGLCSPASRQHGL